MFVILICTIIFSTIYCVYRYFIPASNINPSNKYVLISGCDTGIGHALAIELDRRGFHVFASVLRLENVKQLKEKLSPRAVVFPMDITKQEDIDAAYDLVQRTTQTLHALVNNSGIITHGCIDWTSLTMMRQVMDVNFFGHLAMTKKFLPLLITKRDSRVVNVGSATGFFAFPNTSAYSASKHALKSFSDCLRREMAPWRLRVSIIEPGSLRTGMLDGYDDNLRHLWSKLPDDVQQRWGINYLNSIITTSMNSPFVTHSDDPFRVVRAIQHAVMSTEPRLHYRPGWQAKVIFYFLYQCPTWLSDKLLALALHFIPDGVQYQSLN